MNSWTETCAVSWTGSLEKVQKLGWWLLGMTLFLIFFIALTVNGKLMLSEMLDLIIFQQANIETLPLEWRRKSGDESPYPVTLGKSFRPHLFILRLSIDAIATDCPADSWVYLTGTKEGFRMTEETEARLSSKGIKFASDSLELKNIGDVLEFQHSSSGHACFDSFQLRYCMKRKKPVILVLLILYILAILASIGVYRWIM